ncbi:MspA family porin [Nocardia africana]|uniref:MspA family porin n=1 Tax=Nocardia africana TaxID=134964 RepID=A0ABW6NUI7_9NOCA
MALWACRAEPGHAQPPQADISGSGIHLVASIDNIRVDPPGDRTPNYLMSFSHAAQLSGDYSVSADGAAITSGQAVAGFLLGCGISVAGGVSIGISPNQGLNLSISPTVTTPSVGIATPSATGVPSPPSVTVSPPSASLGPTFGGSLGLSESLSGSLGPGQVTSVSTAVAALNQATGFPFHIRFTNAALNVSQCASPVSAVPFITTSVSTPQGLAQTTAYGTQFTF